MSDFPNGRPPGQNNIDATTERYVDADKDPSANAVKPDHEQSEDSGIEARDPIDPKVQQELDQAAKNMVEPSSAEQDEDEQPKPQARPQAPATKADPNETKDTKPGAAASTQKK